MSEINNWDDNASITGTNEDDNLGNWGGNNVTINTGDGANKVYSSEGNNILINGGSGDDSIRTWDGAQITINANGGNDTIDNFQASKISMVGGTGNDSFMNWSGTEITVEAGDGNDTVKNSGAQMIIFGGAGNDSICNDTLLTYASDGVNLVTFSPDNVFIDAGNDNDTIFNVGNNVAITGGAGDDSISNGGTDCLITGGYGNDTLTGHAAFDLFAYAGGNDVITNYSGEDIVYISTGGINSYSFNGADLIFNVNGGSLTLKSMKNHAITVQDASGNVSLQIYGTGYSGADVMRNFVQSMASSTLDANQKVDAAIRSCSHFNSLQDVKTQLINDLLTVGDAETFLRDYCGIFRDNADMGAVTGWDAGGLTIKTTDDLLPTSYSDVYPPSTMFTARGLTLVVPDRSTLNEQQQLVVKKIYSADMNDALKLIEDTYGFSFTGKPLTIPLTFVYQPGYGTAWASTGGLTVNMSSGGDDPSYYLAHELTHVAQQHFGFFNGLPGYMFEGMADVTANGDVRDTLQLAQDPVRLAQCLNGGSGSGDDYTAGVIFWRYFMRQAADNYNGTTSTGQVISYTGQPVTLGGSFMGGKFSGNNFVVNSSAGTLVIQNAADKVVDLRDSAGNEFVKAYKASTAGVIDMRGLVGYEIVEGSSAGTDVIFAGYGGSELWGGSGFDADALVGGLGTDIFNGGRFQGADIFYNASSSDIVNLTDASLSDIVGTAEVNGSVLIAFNTGNAVNIQSTELLSAAIKLADGVSLRFNHATKTWQGA